MAVHFEIGCLRFMSLMDLVYFKAAFYIFHNNTYLWSISWSSSTTICINFLSQRNVRK